MIVKNGYAKVSMRQIIDGVHTGGSGAQKGLDHKVFIHGARNQRWTIWSIHELSMPHRLYIGLHVQSDKW
jgi:hypothetical protein